MSAGERWIVVNDWDRFQHYKDRRPTWIKNYVELLDDSAYLGLTLPQRALLHDLWLLYASARRAIREDTTALSRRLGQRITSAQLEALNRAGFITFSASKPLAEPEHPASPDKEKEEEKKVVKNQSSTTIPCPANGDEGRACHKTGRPHAIAEHLAIQHWPTWDDQRINEWLKEHSE